MFSSLPAWMNNIIPILLLLLGVTVVISRLPKIDVGHSKPFRKRRLMNWLPLGLTYALLYMGRYNLTVSKGVFESIPGSNGSSLMGNDAFGIIFGVGTVVYGVSFIINGPLTDRFGGRFSMLVGTGGTLLVNLLMGLATFSLLEQGPGSDFIAQHFVGVFSVLYAFNMYFQSFGAVAIVKVNAAWFHVRERGVFGAIFGILISLGLYFAYDWGKLVLDNMGLVWVFIAPALLLSIFWILDYFLVRDTPGETGHKDFDTADASSGDNGPRMGAVRVFMMMLKNPIIMTIAIIEFCSGFLRQAIMQWYRTFAKQTDGILGLQKGFISENWGLLLCLAGILGGVVAGVISDHVFSSRRGPVAAWLYGVLLTGSLLLIFLFKTPFVGIMVLIMSVAVIGVHGMLSGTASMDFGGRKNAGIAVGIIDGFVYLGTAAMSFTYALLLPKEQLDVGGKIIGPATDPSNWIAWPLAMIPIAAIGLFLAIKIWRAFPSAQKSKA